MMKFPPALLIAIGMLTLPALAGPRVSVFINTGAFACAPRPCVRPVCFIPRPVVIYAQPVCYACRTGVPSYCNFAPTYYHPGAPACTTPAYRAPLVNTGVSVAGNTFTWRR
jgi:hypothetical protein